MSGRQTLLAEIEARRRAQAQKDTTGTVEILAADLALEPDDTSYNPYDKPGAAKPLKVERGVTPRRRAFLKNKKRR
ncbi:MAG: hypothetical protein QNI96_15145 [Woeseiaceae bacterium]|nr:hypothetical protein [Woeseiaceae bacterium]